MTTAEERMDRAGKHHRVDAAVLRASTHLGDVVPPWWPEEQGDGDSRWCTWLSEAWARGGVAEAVATASPALAGQVSVVCDGARPGSIQIRRLAYSLARYLVRMRGRATPFGLFAGVAPLQFGQATQVRWSDRRQLRVRPEAAWLNAMIDQLESVPAIRSRLTVVVNELAMVRGDRLVVPCAGVTGTAELSMRHSAAVALAMRLAASPVQLPVLVEKVVDEFPRCDGSAVEAMMATLINAQVLITCLRPASTNCDPLAYVIDTLSSIDAPDAAAALAELRAFRTVADAAS